LASTGSMGLWMPSQKTRIRVNRVIISLGNRELLVKVLVASNDTACRRALSG
jgi:hypothetical protein